MTHCHCVVIPRGVKCVIHFLGQTLFIENGSEILEDGNSSRAGLCPRSAVSHSCDNI